MLDKHPIFVKPSFSHDCRPESDECFFTPWYLQRPPNFWHGFDLITFPSTFHQHPVNIPNQCPHPNNVLLAKNPWALKWSMTYDHLFIIHWPMYLSVECLDPSTSGKCPVAAPSLFDSSARTCATFCISSCGRYGEAVRMRCGKWRLHQQKWWCQHGDSLTKIDWRRVEYGRNWAFGDRGSMFTAPVPMGRSKDLTHKFTTGNLLFSEFTRGGLASTDISGQGFLWHIRNLPVVKSKLSQSIWWTP